MKLLIYECKKILNIRLIVVLAVFTVLFYNMFFSVTSHPQDSADCQADHDFAAILREEYGYETHLKYEDFDVLEEIRMEQIAQLDKLVQESEVFQAAGITSYEKLRDMHDLDAMNEELQEEYYRIAFGDGIRNVFLIQHLEGILDDQKVVQVVGVEAGKEVEAADTFMMYNSSFEDYTNGAVERVAEVIKENRLSLMPESVMHHFLFDLPRFGILLLISCLLLILPYQIRERLAGVNPMIATTHTGRKIWSKRYIAAVLSCVFICVVQFLGFCLVLQKAEILQFWNYAVSGNGRCIYWFDMSMGTYLLMHLFLYTWIAIGAVTVFYLISRLSANYIVGVAVAVPVTALLGVLLSTCTNQFLEVERSLAYDVLRPLGYGLGMLVLAIVMKYCMDRWDRKRDIFV